MSAPETRTAHPHDSRIRSSLWLSAVVVAATIGTIVVLVPRTPDRASRGERVGAVDLDDADMAEARRLGLVLPRGATRVYLKARDARGATVRFIRFDLPPEAYRSYRAELARRPGVEAGRPAGDSPTPPDWPRFRELPDFDPPAWWLEHQKGRPAPTIVGPRAVTGSPEKVEAELWILDDEASRIYLTTWVAPRRLAPRLRLRPR